MVCCPNQHNNIWEFVESIKHTKYENIKLFTLEFSVIWLHISWKCSVFSQKCFIQTLTYRVVLNKCYGWLKFKGWRRYYIHTESAILSSLKHNFISNSHKTFAIFCLWQIYYIKMTLKLLRISVWHLGTEKKVTDDFLFENWVVISTWQR